MTAARRRRRYHESSRGKEMRRRYKESALGKANRAKQYKKRYLAVQALFAEMKSAPCADCGGRFPPVCMDFDHRDRSAKVRNVGRMHTTTVTAVRREMAKCDLVCSNCHRIRTMLRRDWMPVPDEETTTPQLVLNFMENSDD